MPRDMEPYVVEWETIAHVPLKQLKPQVAKLYEGMQRTTPSKLADHFTAVSGSCILCEIVYKIFSLAR